MKHIKKNLTLLLFVSIMLLSSCEKVRLPQANYTENAENLYIHEILKYKNSELSVNDSIIEDFLEFYLKSLENLPEMDYTKWYYAIGIDKNTPYLEIDSILKEIEKARTFRLFFLVNNIKDTVGYNLGIPPYTYLSSEENYVPDTVSFDNLIELKENSVYINGRQTNGNAIDLKIKEMVFKKELVALNVEKDIKYESVIDILSTYHKYLQHFKELYSELTFNKKYSWFNELPVYYSNIKYKVDKEYRSRIIHINLDLYKGKVISIADEYTINYAP